MLDSSSCANLLGGSCDTAAHTCAHPNPRNLTTTNPVSRLLAWMLVPIQNQAMCPWKSYPCSHEGAAGEVLVQVQVVQYHMDGVCTHGGQGRRRQAVFMVVLVPWTPWSSMVWLSCARVEGHSHLSSFSRHQKSADAVLWDGCKVRSGTWQQWPSSSGQTCQTLSSDYIT